MQAAGNLVICIQYLYPNVPTCCSGPEDRSAFLACLYLVDSPMLTIENPPIHDGLLCMYN